jgi:hypothetical protein
LVIGESYKLITFDVVADPSTYAAFQEKVVGKPRKESVNWSSQVTRKGRSEYESRNKNESTSVYTVSKEALIACLGGIVKSQTEQFVSRLG